MITCDNISLVRNDKYVIANVAFSLMSGSVLILKGGNGSGKTSLIRVMLGMLEPSSGNVRVNNIKINDSRIYNDYMQSSVYLGHVNAFNDVLTVEQNLEFWVNLWGVSELLGITVHYFDLKSVMSCRYKNLSAGWKRRVAFARVMLSETVFWFLDEPFVNMDAGLRDVCCKLIASRANQGGIIVIADNQNIQQENEYLEGAAVIDLSDFAPSEI